jgi:ABC-type phosphate transport system auxiliary subunit
MSTVDAYVIRKTQIDDMIQKLTTAQKELLNENRQIHDQVEELNQKKTRNDLTIVNHQGAIDMLRHIVANSDNNNKEKPEDVVPKLSIVDPVQVTEIQHPSAQD